MHIIAILLVFPSLGEAQNINLTKHQTFDRLYSPIADTSENFHSSIFPYSKKEFDKALSYDSLLQDLDLNVNSTLGKLLLNYQMIEGEKNSMSLTLSPIINIGAGIEKNDSSSNSINEIAFGLSSQLLFGEKWTGEFSFLADKSNYPKHLVSILESEQSGNGYGYFKNSSSMYYQGYLNYEASDIFNFQAGMGKHFIGDGYRSLFLSDYSSSYPYFKATATFWKIKYMALYSNHFDIRNSNGSFSDYRHKFAATHYLSYNATKWLNIGFFESIVWQAQEDNYYRGIDINYLNPIIFLRPVEYFQGSADNALLGGGLKLRIKKKYIFYSQLLLDEFLLSELRANNGWWGNKYGVQAGFKTHYLFGINNLSLQVEMNNVRPFTYSYFEQPTQLNTLQNYGHSNQSLAHPLGANFKEVFGKISLNKKRWIFEAQSTVARIGTDTNQFSVGQNIYQPYNNREQDYGYNTAGGFNSTIMNNSVRVTYVLNPAMQTLIQLGVNNRQVKYDGGNTSSNWISFGIKTALINQYFDR